ncbi:chorismate synthase, partial [Campylobacter jejuni]|uniref:chorismate synthase n=1 Tax=Campylobacter jejuni TaxID=197 RepID=UPI00131A0C3B
CDLECDKIGEIFCYGPKLESDYKNERLNRRNSEVSVDAAVVTKVCGVLVAVGAVLYYKLDCKIAHVFMVVNAVKGIEIGDGIN